MRKNQFSNNDKYNNFTNNYLINTLTSDGLYYLFDSRNPKEFNKLYFKNLSKDYVSSYAKSKAWEITLKYTAKKLGKTYIKKIVIHGFFSMYVK